MRYARKVSGPILDRIDITVSLMRIPFSKLREENTESSEEIRKRVETARAVQNERFGALKITCNAELSARQINNFCKIDAQSTQMLEAAHNKFHLSPRGISRILKVSRTIADLSQEKNIGPQHIAEAIQYRQKEES